MADLIGLIPAAGRGVRAYPYTATVPKSMLEVDGVPVLQRNIELMRDELDIREIVIVLGHHGDVIRGRFGDGARLGVQLRYVINDRLDLELAYSVLVGGRGIDRPCCMILADECYIGSNHRELPALPADAFAACGVIAAEYARQIRKNYSVVIEQGRIVDLVEKPRSVEGPLMGTGTYFLSPEVFRRLESAHADPRARPRDWTSWLGEQARLGARILPLQLSGQYVNINSRDDLNHANALLRSLDFEQRRISLVYVADGAMSANPLPLQRFARISGIDEILVVTGRRSEVMEGAAAALSARVVTAATPELPIGALVKLGLDRASGDILLLGYSDDTFDPGDVQKFVAYLRDADLVIGTRTTRQLNEQGTNMRGVVRAAHLILAKWLELLWWRFEPRLTDVCCVYRAFWRSTYESIRDHIRSEGIEVYPEMVVEVLRSRRRVVEIPINYYNRDLHERHVRSPYQNVATFLRMAGLILARRLEEAALRRGLNLAAPEAELSRQRSPEELEEARELRALERRWQDDVGQALLDKPYETAGSRAVFERQSDRLIGLLDARPGGLVIEVGCGKGHFLERLRARSGERSWRLVGIDISRAVTGVRERGIAALRADGERLPFPDASAACVIYDGALHHCIDYPGALAEAVRVLEPGGSILLFEPSTSWFNRAVHHLLDPIVFRKAAVYESPIDIRYKDSFRQSIVVAALRRQGLHVQQSRSDFLAYPLTGCYAGSVFARSARAMQLLIAVEDRVAKWPLLRSLADALAWRFTIVATKPTH